MIKRVRPTEKRILIDTLGEWDWSDGRTVIFTDGSSIYEESVIPKGFGSNYISIFYPERSNCLIGIEDRGNLVWRFRTVSEHVEISATLFNRENTEAGFHFLKAFTLDDGVALIYEGGVLYFNDDGSLRWRRDHKKLDLLFENLTEGGVRYKDLFGNEWVYNTNNGDRRKI
jgi:hypothetical protein